MILLRREWLGFAAAVLFGLCVAVGMFCWLIAPTALPFWSPIVAWCTSAGTWVAAQMLLRSRRAFLRDPDLPEQLASLRRQAESALEAGNLNQARGLVRIALTLDDEDVETNVSWARLLDAEGKPKESRRVWRRVSRLDPGSGARSGVSDAPVSHRD